MVLLQGQVVGLLQGEQHRPYQGDLGGAETNKLDMLGPALAGTPNIRHQTPTGCGMYADANANADHSLGHFEQLVCLRFPNASHELLEITHQSASGTCWGWGGRHEQNKFG